MECHTTALPLVAAYNGFNNGFHNNGYTDDVILDSIRGNASEGRLSDQITANNINSESRYHFAEIDARLEGVRGKQDNLGKDICDVTKSVLIENARTREISAAQFAAIQIKQAEDTAAIQLDACKNTNAILAKIAECCCEQKTLTISQGAETRALINGNTIQALQTELAAANLALAFKK